MGSNQGRACVPVVLPIMLRSRTNLPPIAPPLQPALQSTPPFNTPQLFVGMPVKPTARESKLPAAAATATAPSQGEGAPLAPSSAQHGSGPGSSSPSSWQGLQLPFAGLGGSAPGPLSPLHTQLLQLQEPAGALAAGLLLYCPMPARCHLHADP